MSGCNGTINNHTSHFNPDDKCNQCGLIYIEHINPDGSWKFKHLFLKKEVEPSDFVPGG